MSGLQLLSAWSNAIWRLTLNHLWQATIFFVIALLASLLLRRAPARARYLVWLAASIKFALPSAVVLLALSSAGIRPQSMLDSSRRYAPTLHYLTPIVSPVANPVDSVPAPEPLPFLKGQVAKPRAQPGASRLGLVLSIFWLAGATAFFHGWVKRRRQVASAIEAGRVVRVGREWQALTKVTSWLGITRRVDLIVTPAVTEPGVWRVLGPIVLLPEAIISQLDDEELETLMMHEMAHVLRWDNLVSNLNMVLCCLFWFNPLIWLIDTWLLREREEACDEVVLRWSGASQTYAASIKKIYRFCLNSPVSGLSAAGGSRLKHRLERILGNRGDQPFCMSHRVLVGSMIIGSLMLSVLAGLQPPNRLVPRTQSAFQQLLNKQPEISPEGKECTESDDKCVLLANAPIVAQAELGHVVVRSDPGAPTTASWNKEPANKAPEGRAIKATLEQPAVFQSAHVVDLKKFIGRYAVDPSVMENFVFDVSLEDGDLWFKPSHTQKHRLIAHSTVDYVDSAVPDTRITFTFDATGNVESLTLRGWQETIVALRLVLPAPSREGNITFTLSGFSAARIVAVAGTFNGWNQSQYLFEHIGNEWICRINLPPGQYQYEFIVDGNWLVDPRNPTVVHDERGFENSKIIVR